MAGADSVALGIESTNSIVEQLGKTFNELKAHEDAPENNVHWKEIEVYFHNLEALLKKKLDALEERAKTFEVKEFETCILVQEREGIVAAKEQAMLDRVQELKEAAVAVIEEAREKYKPAFPDLTIVDGNADNKVTSSLNANPNATNPDTEGNSPNKPSELAMEDEFQPLPELTQFCEQMDAKGLLSFITENEKHISSIQQEIPVALRSATEPARLVLESLEGFYPPDINTSQGDKTDAALQGLRKSCVLLMEAVTPLLLGSEKDDDTLTPETKQQAKAIADEWKPRLVETGTDVANGNSVEAEAFLQLLATFKIASEFDEEELCKLVLAIAFHRQTPELCRSLGLTEKMPGVIDTLINKGRQIDAVHLIHGFKLTENFPPVPLLKTYLKDLRRNSQGKGASSGGGGPQIDVNTRELNALKAVVKCVEEYELQSEYPLDPLHRRLSQLERSKTDKKRTGEIVRHQPPKRARANGGFYGHRKPLSGASDRRPPQVYGEVGGYTGVSERYPPVAATAYNYQAPSQGVYGQHDIAPPRSHYYPQDEIAAAPTYGTAASSYGAAASYDSYVGPQSTYGAAPVYGGPGAPVNYGAYMGAGISSSHPTNQSYI